MNRPRELVTIVRMLMRAYGGGDEQTRYMARYGLMYRLARMWGFTLYNNNLVWQEDAESLAAWRQFPAANGDLKDRHFILYQIARSVAELPGDTVECGVLEGAGSHLICAATERPGRTHHVFDSFQGLSEPQPGDVPRHDYTYRWKKHDLSVPRDRVAHNLAAHPAVQYHEGWIPARFPDVADRRFCLVHVDVDLEQPTADSIAFFYPRLVPGGILLCDDYGSAACPGAKESFDRYMADKPERRVVHLPTGQGFVVKR